MSSSILTSTKKNLGIAEDDDSFDVDVIIHINSVFSTLHQLGLGPADGFMIEDASALWEDFLGSDNRINSVKTYVYFKVKLAFDPPTTSYLIASMERQAQELEFRLNVVMEGDNWVDPDPDDEEIDPEDDIVVDGGPA